MKQFNNKIIFFGASKFVIPILEVLKNNFDLVLVVTTEKSSSEPVTLFSIKNKIAHLSIQQFNNETILTIKEANASLAVLAFFGLILPKEILDILPKGIINVHPSLLPQYRGPTPVQTALLNGDTETGVTIIKLDEEVDHGPILAQEKEPIRAVDTSESLHERLFAKGAHLFVPIIRTITLNKSVPETPQDHTKATFTQHLSRQSGYFDSLNPPNPQILNRMIRAYYPWPGVWTRIVLRSHLDKGVTFRKEKIVKLFPDKKIQVEGKKPMSLKDFINGYPNAKDIILPLFR